MLALAPSAPDAARRLDLAAEIVSAYVSNNSLPAGELPDLLRTVHDALATVHYGRPPADLAPEPPKPAVPIRKSVHDDFIVCLENGRRFKSLKRHLASAHGLTPDQYRARWGLPKDYPMVAPAYASARSALAREIGLGRRPEGGERSADPGPSLEGAALRPRPRRRPEADEAVS